MNSVPPIDKEDRHIRPYHKEFSLLEGVECRLSSYTYTHCRGFLLAKFGYLWIVVGMDMTIVSAPSLVYDADERQDLGVKPPP